MRKLVIIALFLISISNFAQDNPTPPVISAENFLNLQSVAQIDFDGGIVVPSVVPGGEEQVLDAPFLTGWFALDSVRDRVVVVDDNNIFHAVLFSGITNYTFGLSTEDADSATTFIDATFAKGIFAMVQTTPTGYLVTYNTLDLYGGTGQWMRVDSDDRPQSIWLGCSGAISCYTGLEIDHAGEPQVVTLPPFTATAGGSEAFDLDENVLHRLPYAPAQDPEAVVRIGRIPPPYTVTSSIDGIVKLWNLETGEVLYEIDNGTAQAAVFGNINADATHLAWRDPESTALYLLNFETGENRFIDELDGAYVQWFFLSNDASVIIAVNSDFEPNIIAWDVETGERRILGEYRHCNRPQPDMARLSADGTTLVIGCDTGLDIWRVVDE